MHRHTHQTAAVKAITVIQARLWETVGVCVGPPAPPSGSARSDECTDTADISYMCSKLKKKFISSFICVGSIITSVFFQGGKGGRRGSRGIISAMIQPANINGNKKTPTWSSYSCKTHLPS